MRSFSTSKCTNCVGRSGSSEPAWKADSAAHSAQGSGREDSETRHLSISNLSTGHSVIVILRFKSPVS